MIPVRQASRSSWTAATPIDDERMMGFTVTLASGPTAERAGAAPRSSRGRCAHRSGPDDVQPVRNKDNEYLIDRALQRSRSFVHRHPRHPRRGPGGAGEHGARSSIAADEHLGSADLAVIATRRRLLEAVRALAEQGSQPYESLTPDAYRVRSAAVVLPREVAWHEGAAEAMLARV